MSSDYLEPERKFFEGHPHPIGSLSRLFICFVTLGLGYIFFWLQSRTKTYLITDQRVLIEEGLFSQTVHTIELYKIEDIAIQKPFGQRLLGTGNLIIYTKDVTHPQVLLERLPIDVRQLYELMRPAIQAAKRLYLREDLRD
ncbi:MAG: PH domain-containing protein [Pseudanabaenaceae cyanobacterium SKYGB_i_bin29]|nr:PH domain-containing protein [Pseudanabaenaceae cyanobacterium SKYG29]MDW8421474.1 PH domain-containing protein [Pseudanabaenaceae cyanobacterium SKYGB_i_bin29]